MDTNIFEEQDEIKDLRNLKIKGKNYLNIHKKKHYKNRYLFINIYLACLIFYNFILHFSLCLNDNEVAFRIKAQTSTSKVTFLDSTNKIISMSVNGNNIFPVAKSVTPPFIKKEFEVLITYDELTDCKNLFASLKSAVIGLDLSNLDTSQCTTFERMFYQTKNVASIKTGSKFQTGNGKDMTSMFDAFGAKDCIYNNDMFNFDTSQVTKMKNMFSNSCFKILDLRSFDTSNVDNMESMFESSKAVSLDLSSFDTRKVTTINAMFSSMTQLISLDISNFELNENVIVIHLFFQMGATLKLCPKTKSYEIIKAQLEEAQKTSKCDDPCFSGHDNKFLGSDCVESCQDTNSKFEYRNECKDKCPPKTEEYPEGSFICIDILDCSDSYYNLDKTDCIDEVPSGYYCNDLTARTIAKCPDKCTECELDSVNEDLCKECNPENSYYEVEDYNPNNNDYKTCMDIAPEGYYFDVTMFKKCYESCKTCNELGDENNHKCDSCKDDLISDGLPNCYDKCPPGEYYYFDDSNVFDCTDSCPSGYNKIEQKLKCSKDCRNDAPYIYEFEGNCLEECPEKYHAPNDDKVCVLALHCDNYYNYEYTGCEETIPEGFYCNNTEARTLDKCKQKCKTCSYESVNDNNLCTECNKDDNYFPKEDGMNTGGHIDCYNTLPEGYFLEDKIYKKCYKSCKSCDSLGNVFEHFCTDCPDGYTKNGTSNCYEICDYHYYFDSNMEYFCTKSEECPSDRSKLIVDKNECVGECIGNYRFEFDNKCYKACPSGSYYNFDQTNCIAEVPEGFYLNDTQTIDKCYKKCQECNLQSTNDEGYACISCNNAQLFYKKEDDIRDNNYYDCVTGAQDGYYLDEDNKEYKRCHKTCKSCEEKGDVRNNKCTGCYTNSTLNGTNCFAICKFYHYFDDSGEYFCTESTSCPSSRSKLIVDTNECVEECTGQYKFEFEDKCYTGCPPQTYYNYSQTGCLGSIPEGYYMNDSLKRTIDICDIKCENECKLDFENNNVICKGCNNQLDFYKKEDDVVQDGYYDCYDGDIEKYFIDFTEKEYKKCYLTCLFCSEFGDAVNHKCTACSSQYTHNGTNCFLNCQYYHFFDSNQVYQCTENNECPPDFPNLIVGEKSCVKKCPSKLIVDKKECANECTGQYKFEFDDKCYTSCPPETYYNYTQTGCIDTIPVGYYMNDSRKRTIDKCDIKCEKECFLGQTSNKVLCKACNNLKNYFKKEIDEVENGYYDCYTGNVEKYYLDKDDKVYKKCYESCKFCTELGGILEHKCTACFNKYTLNGTNCYEICDYFYYFDSNNIYHCTTNGNCPSEKPNKIVERKTCVQNCEDEEKYNMVFENRCYEKCPEYYNYEQTKCIGQIPEGFYLNDTTARTIDKCIEKCETCETDSVKIDQCLKCNNAKDYYLKENDQNNKDKYINCYTSLVEGHYLDKTEKKYKKCFEKCKNCDGAGIITDHKCTECNSDFTLNGTNCYEICPYYYYFSSDGIYHCTETEECPFRYFLIPEKRQCIDNCENDDIYIYSHRGICLDTPYIQNCNSTSTFVEKETGECVEECPADDFIEEYCGLRNSIPINQDTVISMLTEAISTGSLNGYIGEMLSGIRGDYLIMEETMTYHLTSLKGNNLLKNQITDVSSVDLGDCENKLRDKYKIVQELPLIILKIDYYLNYSLIPVIGYEVFDPTTLQKLDLSICENNVLSLKVPTEILNETSIYIYDPDSSYYNDECTPSIESNYDIILNDRQNAFISNNLSICEKNCVFKEYDSENKKSICECHIKNNLLSSTEIHYKEDLFLSEFSTAQSSSVNSMKCVSTFLTKDGITKNIAFYIYILLFIGLIFCCVQFYRKGFNSLKGHINQILTSKEKKTEEEVPKIENNDDYSDKINQKTLDRILKLRTPKNFRNDFRGVIAKDDITYQDNYSTNQKSINKLEIYNFRGNDANTNNYHLDTEKEITYTDFEINSFTYKQAIGVDIRPFKTIYLSLIKYNHPLFCIFNKAKDYNSIYIKVSLIFISFSLYYFINSLFITKSLLHDLYEAQNQNDISRFLPYIFISFIIGYALEKIIRYFSLSDNNILSIYRESLYNNAKIRATQVRKLLLVKYILFYVFGFGSVLIFGYYLATFGSVYKNSQFILIKNVIISYVISLIFPFIIIVLPSLFRRYSLKDATRQCMFNLSRVLQYI